MIAKKMNGSDLSDLLFESGLIGSGPIHEVLSGKHYDRAIHCGKILMEGLERVLFERYLQMKDTFLQHGIRKRTPIDEGIQTPSKGTNMKLLQDQSLYDYLDTYIQFRNTV